MNTHSITNHSSNANWRRREISPHTSPNGYHQKDSRNGNYWRRRWRKGMPRCWWKCKLEKPLWSTVWKLPQKLKTDWPYDLAVPVLGVHLEEMKSPAEKATCTSTFTAPFSPCNTLDPLQSFLETWCRAHCPFLSLLSYTDPPSFPSLFPKRLNFSVHSSLTALASHHHNPTS